MTLSISRELSQISNVLKEFSQNDFLHISAAENEVICNKQSVSFPYSIYHTCSYWADRLHSFFENHYNSCETTSSSLQKYFSSSSCQSTIKQLNTLGYFYKIFGMNRCLRIAERIHFPMLMQTNEDRALMKREIGLLFSELAEITEFDMQELLEEIHSDATSLRGLTEEETNRIKGDFQFADTIDACINEQLEQLISILIPFSTIEDLFLHDLPTFSSMGLDSGKTFVGQQERVFIYENMRRYHLSERHWIMDVAKTLMDREIPEGVVFRMEDGNFCKVHAKVHGGGAYKYFLKGIGKAQESSSNWVLYRGSRVPTATDGLETIKEDLRYSIGSYGHSVTNDATYELLYNPEKGFVRTKDEVVKGLGNSLGGNHLMQDVALHPSKFSYIVDVVGPGVTKERVSLPYAEAINQSKVPFKPVIIHYFEAEDVVDQFGESHLGYGCDPEKVDISVVYLEPQDEMHNMPSIEKNLSQELAAICEKKTLSHEYFPILALKACYIFANALMHPHVRHTVSQPHTALIISNSTDNDLVQGILGHKAPYVDERWEELRKMLAFDAYIDKTLASLNSISQQFAARSEELRSLVLGILQMTP